MSLRPKIVYLDAGMADYGDLDLSSLYKLGELTCYNTTKPAQIQSHLGKADIVLLNKFVVDKTTIAAFKNVKLICVSATGFNNIDSMLTKKHGIQVSNVVNYCTDSVAEHCLSLLLAMSHRLREHDSAVHRQVWSRSADFSLNHFPYRELKGKILGIVGYGHIGRRVAELAKCFGMRIIVAALPGKKYRTGKKRVPLKEIFSAADFISLHCPLTDLTRELVNAKTLAWIRPTACLLNLSRGGLVNEKALAKALKQGQLNAYATDVLSVEPPSPQNPLLDKSLHDKILITPHVAWASLEARQRLMDDMAKTITAFLSGKKRNVVNG